METLMDLMQTLTEDPRKPKLYIFALLRLLDFVQVTDSPPWVLPYPPSDSYSKNITRFDERATVPIDT